MNAYETAVAKTEEMSKLMILNGHTHTLIPTEIHHSIVLSDNAGVIQLCPALYENGNASADKFRWEVMFYATGNLAVSELGLDASVEDAYKFVVASLKEENGQLTNQ